MSFPFHRALVTGGAGFIGSHIVKRLLKEGVEVVSIDSYVTGKSENLADLSHENLQEIDCDVVDYDQLKPHFEGVDVVFHNAASKKTVCLKDPRLDLDTNAKGTFNLLELSRDHGVKKFVHASTGSVYGEAQYYPQDEKHVLLPTSYYGVSKLAGERYAMVFNQLYDLDVTILRYFHVFGPKQESSEFGGVVAIFSRKAIAGEPLLIFGDGEQLRSFTYVEDVVSANMLVATHKDTKGEVYNCASGIQVTIKELADKVIGLSGKELEIEYGDWTIGDIKYFKVSNEKLRSLGLEFQTDFDAGLKDTFEWFKKELSQGNA